MLIFKEAMNNCLKYSQAQNASFLVRLRHDELILTLKDDGIGFDPNEEFKGYGILNMKRAQQYRGNNLGHCDYFPFFGLTYDPAM